MSPALNVSTPVLAIHGSAILSLGVAIGALLAITLSLVYIQQRAVRAAAPQPFIRDRVKGRSVASFVVVAATLLMLGFFLYQPGVGRQTVRSLSRMSKWLPPPPPHPDRVGVRPEREAPSHGEFVREHAQELGAEFGRMAEHMAGRVEDAAESIVITALDPEIDSEDQWAEALADAEDEQDGLLQVDRAGARSTSRDSRAMRLRRGEQTRERGDGFARLAWPALIGLATMAFLYVGYLFLDAGTRGQFTWQLRALSVVAFAGILIAVWSVRQIL